MIADAYRALALLSKHPGIDPSRIALMGFSKGGAVALAASLTRFQRMHSQPGVEFAAYIPFYAPCFITYIDDSQVSDRPIRLFHGSADDYVPVAPCREYVERLRALGKDIQLTEYPGVRHSFDNSSRPLVLELPNAQNPTRCRIEERPGGEGRQRRNRSALQTRRPLHDARSFRRLRRPCSRRGHQGREGIPALVVEPYRSLSPLPDYCASVVTSAPVGA